VLLPRALLKLRRLRVYESSTPLKGLNRSRSSYGLKYLAEGVRGDHLTNGAFIAEPRLAGFNRVVKGADMLERDVHIKTSESATSRTRIDVATH
jgi:hypothetical protein